MTWDRLLGKNQRFKNNKNGILVPVNDVNELANSMNRVINDFELSKGIIFGKLDIDTIKEVIRLSWWKFERHIARAVEMRLKLIIYCLDKFLFIFNLSWVTFNKY